MTVNGLKLAVVISATALLTMGCASSTATIAFLESEKSTTTVEMNAGKPTVEALTIWYRSDRDILADLNRSETEKLYGFHVYACSNANDGERLGDRPPDTRETGYVQRSQGLFSDISGVVFQSTIPVAQFSFVEEEFAQGVPLCGRIWVHGMPGLLYETNEIAIAYPRE